MPVIFDFHRDNKVGLLDSLWKGVRWGMVGGSILALKLLWTRVSSKSRTRHFLPTCSGEMGGKSGFGTPSYTEMRRWKEGRKK